MHTFFDLPRKAEKSREKGRGFAYRHSLFRTYFPPAPKGCPQRGIATVLPFRSPGRNAFFERTNANERRLLFTMFRDKFSPSRTRIRRFKSSRKISVSSHFAPIAKIDARLFSNNVRRNLRDRFATLNSNHAFLSPKNTSITAFTLVRQRQKPPFSRINNNF